MAHHDKSVRERVVALVEEGGISASATDGRLWFQGPRQEHSYRNTVRMNTLEGAEKLGYGVYPVISPVQGSLRLLPTFLDRKVRLFRD
jgi:hypothetical protein